MNEPIRESQAMRRVWQQAVTAAGSAATVLITGETGTGKGLLAEAIHRQSARAAKPFAKVTIPGIPRELLESELFGHERGAFTGAHRRRIGMIESASGGTLFLDEIGDMEQSLQAKIHGFMDDRAVRRIGGTEVHPVNVRLIFATSRDLAAMVEAHQFRADLYYRMRVLHIHIPPLRDRPEDILPLAKRAAAPTGHSFTPEAERLLLDYPWPGNVRELLNAVEQAIHNSAGETVLTPVAFAFLQTDYRLRPFPPGRLVPLAEWVARNRAAYIRSVVEQCNGNKSLAALKLRCSMATVYRAL